MMKNTWIQRRLGALTLLGLGALAFLSPLAAEAATAECDERGVGSCEVSNDDGVDAYSCTCEDKSESDTGGDAEWAGLDEKGLAEVCEALIQDQCAAADTDGDTDTDTDTETDTDGATDTDADTDTGASATEGDTDTDTDATESSSSSSSSSTGDDPDTSTTADDSETDPVDVPTSSTQDSGSEDQDSDSGCSCTAGDDGRTGALASLLAIVGFGLRRRRR